MLGSAFLSGLAKLLFVGTIVAGSVAGIYFVASTDDGTDGDEGAIAATATPVVEATGTAEPLETATQPAVETAEPSPTPTWWATPSSPDQAMTIGGYAWVNARPARGVVRAFVGAVECGTAPLGRLRDDYASYYYLEVVSANSKPGCGADGEMVHITVDGDDAAVLPWEPGFRPPVRLFVGPRFAEYHGYVSFDDPPLTYRVEPMVDGVVCGIQIDQGAAADGSYPFYVLVDPAEVTPGCGATGAVVELWLVVNEDGDSFARTQLTAVTWSTLGVVELGTVAASVASAERLP